MNQKIIEKKVNINNLFINMLIFVLFILFSNSTSILGFLQSKDLFLLSLFSLLFILLSPFYPSSLLYLLLFFLLSFLLSFLLTFPSFPSFFFLFTSYFLSNLLCLVQLLNYSSLSKNMLVAFIIPSFGFRLPC